MSGTTLLEYARWRDTALGTVTERLERDAVLDLAVPRMPACRSSCTSPTR